MPDASHSRRYVVLRHESIAEPHFDVMFETADGSPLTTLRVSSWPIDERSTLTRLADHRRIYLDYEGPLSGNRGVVRRVADGTCSVQLESDASIAVTFDTGLALRLAGDRIERPSR